MCNAVTYYYRCGHNERTIYKCSKCQHEEDFCNRTSHFSCCLNELCFHCDDPSECVAGHVSIFDKTPPATIEDPETVMAHRGHGIIVVPLRTSRLVNLAEREIPRITVGAQDP